MRDVHRCMQRNIASDNRTLSQLLVDGLMSELSTRADGSVYMTADEQERARALEADLLADAQAGVDLRVRLINAAIV